MKKGNGSKAERLPLLHLLLTERERGIVHGVARFSIAAQQRNESKGSKDSIRYGFDLEVLEENIRRIKREEITSAASASDTARERERARGGRRKSPNDMENGAEGRMRKEATETRDIPVRYATIQC